METLLDAMREYGLRFAGAVDERDRRELADFWDRTAKEHGGTLSGAEKESILETFESNGMLVRKREVHDTEPVYGKVLFVLENTGVLPASSLSGSFLHPGEGFLFEQDAEEAAPLDVTDAPVPKEDAFPEDGGLAAAKAFEEAEEAGKTLTAVPKEPPKGTEVPDYPVSSLDPRFARLLPVLQENHVGCFLTGYQEGGRTSFLVTGVHVVKGREGSPKPVSEALLQLVITRLLASTLPEKEEAPEDLQLSSIDDIRFFLQTADFTLPSGIRVWADRQLQSLDDENVTAMEKLHVQRALSMMLNVRWESTDFPAIDPRKAKQILDEELYGLEPVKQRVLETIIQINRTHTLPGYGLLLIGPPGTGKSQIAYAVGRILKLPCTVLDMSTIRDPEALTGSSRIYSNARPGRIMEAFSRAGSSNIVFVINELDKADATKDTGSSGDVLLTLLDHLGFTDVYMECAIPTGGVYPIATANDKSRISGPLLSRFSVIEIPDYTPDEKRTIFWNYSLPRVLLRMGMKPGEVVLTDDAVDFIIDRFSDYTGCRELEQAAEHLAGNALFRIETEGKGSVTYRAEDAKLLFGEKQKSDPV